MPVPGQVTCLIELEHASAASFTQVKTSACLLSITPDQRRGGRAILASESNRAATEMFEYRVTKYDPKHRDSEGRYLLDDWTGFSDVGGNVTLAEYEQVEAAYVDVAIAFMTEAGVASLSVRGLENSHQTALPFVNGTQLDVTEFGAAFRLVLREKCWCRFLNATGASVHFGWDFYMYVRTPRGCPNAKNLATQRGLFVEPFRSPYRDLDADEAYEKAR